MKAVLQAAERYHKHFHRENVSHSTRQGDYITLFMSPVVVLPGEAVKAAAEVCLCDGVATVTDWFTGRANTPPELDRRLGELYEAHGFYRPAPGHAKWIALVDQALRQAGELRAFHGSHFVPLLDEQLDGNDVILPAHAGGLATLVLRWHIFILPSGDNMCIVQGTLYDNRYQRIELNIENGRIVLARRISLKPELV